MENEIKIKSTSLKDFEQLELNGESISPKELSIHITPDSRELIITYDLGTIDMHLSGLSVFFTDEISYRYDEILEMIRMQKN